MEDFMQLYGETRGFSLGLPMQPTILADGNTVLFLRAEAKKTSLSLFSLDLKTQQTKCLLTPEILLGGSEGELSAEEKARREYERAIQEATKEEETIRKAMEKAREETAHASAQDRAKFEAQLAELNQKLVDAEAKNQRALSMAQQTRSGHVYIISNIGSFGEDILKIGMTRRLQPEDRIWELSDASVPFDFDVHAMIRSDDAPALERLLHGCFDDLRVNKVNYRKEFFRVPIQRLRDFVAEKALEATFTMTAEAREYRETLALEKMTPEERQKYHLQESDSDAANE